MHFYFPHPMPLYEPPLPNVSAKDWQKKQQATYKKYDIGGGPDNRVGADGKPLYELPPPHISAKDWQKQQQATYKDYDIGGGPDDRVGADGELHYRPSYANNTDFESVRPIKGVDDGFFRFYRQKGNGPVDPHSHAHRHVSGHHGKMVIREKPRIT